MIWKRKKVETEMKVCQLETERIKVTDEIEYLGHRLRLIEIKPGIFALGVVTSNSKEA